MEGTTTVIGFELSAQQKRLWPLREAAAACRAQAVLRVGEERVDLPRLKRAVGEVVARHEILRTRFEARRGERFPLQTVDDPPGSVAVSPPPDAAGFDEVLRAERGAPFDPAGEAPLRVAVAAPSDGSVDIVLTLSALCADAVSLVELARQVSAAYARPGGRTGDEEPLQYLEYAAWQESLVEGDDEEVREGLDHWRRLERGFGEVSRWPWESAEPRAEEGVGGWSASPDSALAAAVEEMARRHDATPADVVLAAWQVFLWRRTGVDGALLGGLYSGRSLEGLEEGLGPYAAYLPVRCRRFRDRPSFGRVVEQVRDDERLSREWEELGPGFLATLDPPLRFEAGFAFLPRVEPWEVGGIRFSMPRRHVGSDRFTLHLTAALEEDGLSLRIDHDLSRFGDIEARHLGRGLAALLRSATAAPETPVSELEVLPRADRHRLLIELNDTGADLGGSEPVHRLIEAAAREHPEREAVVCDGTPLSYRELDERANQLAHHLRERGVGPDAPVGLLLERSTELVVSLLAVLKAGGAFAVLDPLSPTARLGTMIEELDPRAVITGEALLPRLPEAAHELAVRVDADAAAIAGHERTAPPPVEVLDANLLYAVFTSGSTGRPKAVGVEHRQMASYVRAVRHRLGISTPLRYALVSTLAADLGYTALFPALCSGGSVHLLPEDRLLDAEAFGRFMRESAIDVLKIVPSHLGSLVSTPAAEALLPREHLVLGGEASPLRLVERVAGAERAPTVTNHYGPTETTVGVCTHRWRGHRDRTRGVLPLGRPLANCRIHLLDPDLRPVPAGVPGEVCIGGAGVSRGYLGNPARTAVRFVPDPYPAAPGSRMYRSGDAALRLDDGDLVFRGRIDRQCKIRGYRVETGEIEALLVRHGGVAEAVVDAAEGPGGPRLVAYVVPKPGERVTGQELQGFLRDLLPEPMVPAVVVPIDALPLTANGKVDRAALAASQPEERREQEYVAPRDPVETTLVEIWQEVLGVEEIGVAHNFFELGGDSILAIQIISRARQAGLRFEPGQLFEHQTVADLAPYVRAASGPGEAEQGPVTGPVPLTPIQHWFLERVTVEPHHWNQALAFRVRDPLDLRLLGEAVAHLLAHHDALRARFEPVASEDGEGGAWRQSFAAPDPPDPRSFVAVDLGAHDEDELGRRFTAAAAELQTGFDLSEGPLWRVALFTGPGGWQRVLLLAHHLVVDGVSWRILLEDLLLAYGQLERGEAVALPAKTMSYRRWGELLRERAAAGAFDDELDSWRRRAAPAPLPVDHPSGGNTVASARGVTASLDPESTRALLQEVPPVYNTRIDEILLAALTLVLTRWAGAATVQVEVEGHGRGEVVDDIDLTRTVGWFTARYPVELSAREGEDLGTMLKRVKEQVRSIPRKGVAYGIHRYLRDAPAPGLDLAPPEISFNYLGQMDTVLPRSSPLAPAPEPVGSPRSPAGRRLHALEVNGRVLEGRLEVRWTYGGDRYREATVEGLANDFVASLEAIIEHCRTPGAGGVTASDFPLAGLDEGHLDQVAALLEQADRDEAEAP